MPLSSWYKKRKYCIVHDGNHRIIEKNYENNNVCVREDEINYLKVNR